MVDLNRSGSHRDWILRSKLEMPCNNVRLISRPRLLSKMAGWRRLDLGVLVGPAGYAKSTTIAEWCRQEQAQGVAVAWLSLDEADAEPAQFLSYVIASLSSAGIDLQGLEAGAQEGFSAGGISSALAALIDVVSRSGQDVVLVLDDYHRVNSERVDELVKSFLRSVPNNLAIIATTRAALPFDIGHMLAAGRADELDSDELRFTREELATVFPPGASEEALNLLFERTEGWPVAVQLAKLLVADAPTKAHLENFHGNTGHIATYLADQIVNRLEPEVQDFLCRTSPLENFNDDLAAAVTGRDDSNAAIGRLEALNALVVRVDRASFRYHHLFAEYLQNELQRRHGPEAVMEVHRRASRWYEANGHMAEAVKHARQADDRDRCAHLVEAAGGWELILFGGIGYLRGLLQHIQDDVAQSYPRILLAKAYLSVKDGLLADARAQFDAADKGRATGQPSDALDRDLLNVGALVSAYEDTPVSPSDFDTIERQLAAVPVDDPVTRSIMSCQLIIYELALGRFSAADQRSQQTMRTMRQARSVLGLNYCFLHAGLSAMYQGRLKAAEAHFGIARRMADENFAFDPGLRALSRLLSGCLAHWSGDESASMPENLREHLDHVEHYDGWLDIYAAGLVVEARLLGEELGAVARGQRIAKRRGLSRLALLSDAIGLNELNQSDRSSLALKLKLQLPGDVWRKQPFLWLPFLESRLALGQYLASVDRSKAIEALSEGLDCARSIGANVHTLRLLVSRALLLDLSGRRQHAMEDMIEALTLAAPEQVVGPFLCQRGVMPLLRAVVKYARDSYFDILVIEFASHIVARLAGQSGDEAGMLAAGLSGREREVLEELAHGRSNKEIARLLDMTEHTVKFHLKNVFGKLGAERRTEAVARAHELKLI